MIPVLLVGDVSEQEEMDSFNGEASTSVIDTDMSHITTPNQQTGNRTMWWSVITTYFGQVLAVGVGTGGGDGCWGHGQVDRPPSVPPPTPSPAQRSVTGINSHVYLNECSTYM